MNKIIADKIYDEERALYNLKNAEIVNCKFEGPSDGESVLKECRKIVVSDCSFSLRYPLWHANRFVLKRLKMDDKTRAPLWYSDNGSIEFSQIEGVKCLRECKNILVKNCDISSPEFGWRCNKLDIFDSKVDSIYFLFESKNISISNLIMSGKYSFQYMKNVYIKDSNLDTKDAFWHSKNITVENSIIKGEYLGWFSENLTLINCKIIGTQPLCYCKNLRLIDCEMEDCDLSFEYSDLDADVKGHIVSVKNPKSGTIIADSIGEIIAEDSVMHCCAKVFTRKNRLIA
ncbi:MAG: DUF3737 family protein [Clostridium sp.]|nr:DUF3737 family protein [Clostridium sp.]